MRNFSAEVNISSSIRDFLSLSHGGYCKVECKGMASLFLVKEGSALFSINNGDAVRVGAGGIYCTTGGVDIVICANESSEGLSDQDQLTPVDFLDTENPQVVDGSAAIFFHTAIPSIANPLPGVLPPSIALSSEEIKSVSGLSSIFELFQNDLLLKSNTREFAYKRLAEIIATSINEFALERLEAEMTVADEGFQNLRMTRVLNAIHQHPEYKWTLISMADKANLSRSAFAKEFKALTGTGPLHYLVRIRMERAAYELRNGQKAISQIADEAGYESDASFNKAFRKIIGDTPGHYRRKMVPRTP